MTITELAEQWRSAKLRTVEAGLAVNQAARAVACAVETEQNAIRVEQAAERAYWKAYDEAAQFRATLRQNGDAT